MSQTKKSVLVMAVALIALAAAAQTIKKVPARYTSPASGKEMYINHCAACHGAEAKGNGPAATALKTAPTDLTTLAKRNNGTFPANHVYSSIVGDLNVPAHGTPEMPMWGNVYSSMSRGRSSEVQQRISNLTAYIESLQVKE
ncbi:MAG TPA: cytochrome c [Terriglobales bacterium]|jgi:mono/diheme cytochrome c family protein|nr:cytochrome c [Terriglobales bacterium]